MKNLLRTIYVVEDEQQFSDPLKKFLSAAHYQVHVFSTWPALHSAIDSQAPFDLLLIDFVLGEEQSVQPAIETISYIRRLRPFLPIVVFTKHAQPNHISRADDAGANDIVMKPPAVTEGYMRDVLLPKLEELLGAVASLDYRKALESLKRLKESELTEDIIIPLFQRMGFERVAAVPCQGPGEFGRDIVPFYAADRFGDRQYYAAQIKAGDINAKATSSSNVIAVLNQAETALRKEFRDDENVCRVIDRVYIVFSGKVTSNAQEILADYLKNNRRIFLIDADRLLGLLQKHNLITQLNKRIPNNKIAILPIVVNTPIPKHITWVDLLKTILENCGQVIGNAHKESYSLLMARERIMPTMIGDFFSMPHACEAPIPQHAILVCVSRQKLPYSTTYERDVDTSVIFLSPECRESENATKIIWVIRQTISEIVQETKHFSMNPQVKTGYLVNELRDRIKTAAFHTKCFVPLELSLK